MAKQKEVQVKGKSMAGRGEGKKEESPDWGDQHIVRFVDCRPKKKKKVFQSKDGLAHTKAGPGGERAVIGKKKGKKGDSFLWGKNLVFENADPLFRKGG